MIQRRFHICKILYPYYVSLVRDTSKKKKNVQINGLIN